jgi:branched-chain amino acid transport system substrate-binding protein
MRSTVQFLPLSAMPRRKLLAGLSLAIAAGLFGLPDVTVHAADPVVVGELNSYTRLPAFTEPYRKGWELALDEINAEGGVLGGRKLEVVSRDDGGTPADAQRVADELVKSEGAVILAGTYFSHVGLAVADYAGQNKVPFLAAEPLTDAIVWAKGNDYTFRLRPSTYMQAKMLAEEAAKLPAKRWVTVAPNYEYGQSAVENFKAALKKLRPDVEFVGEQWPALGKIEAGVTVQALLKEQPEAIFNVTFGADLAKFVREGSLRGLFDGREVVSLLTGEPEYLLPLGEEAPEGWIVTGYPFDQIEGDEHTAFLQAYDAAYSEAPKLGSIVGYVTLKSIAAAINKAGSTDADKLAAAFKGLEIDTPFGPISYRSADHQSTLGAFVGRTAVVDGVPQMVDWHYANGADYLPGGEEAAALRPSN